MSAAPSVCIALVLAVPAVHAVSTNGATAAQAAPRDDAPRAQAAPADGAPEARLEPLPHARDTQESSTSAAPVDPVHRFGRDRIVVGLPDPGWVRGLLVRDAGGATSGFAADLVRTSAGAVGLQVEFVTVETVEEAVEALRTGRVDVVSPLSVTEERLDEVDFTQPILIVHCAVFSRESTPPATTAAQLAPARVTVARDGVAHRWCVENGVPVFEATRLLPALELVADGRADYCITTQLAGRNEIESSRLAGLVDRLLDDDTASRAFAFATAKGNADLLFDINKGLALVRDDGQWDELYDRWLARYQPRPHRTYLSRELVLIAGAVLLAVTSLGLASQWVLRRRLSRQAERLREGEAMFRAIAESLPALVYTSFVGNDGSRSLRYTSPRREEWRVPFPYLRLGEDWASIEDRIHPEDVDRLEAATRRSRAELSRFDLEFRLLASDGRYRWIHSLVTPLRTPEGVLSQGLLLDVTPLRAAEEERQKLEAQLFQAQKLEGLGVLAGGIAHDFNNLMSGVVGNLELARTHLRDVSRAERHLATAESATLRAAELTQQLLAYAGKARLVETTIDLDLVVNEMLGLVEGGLNPRARVRLELEPSSAPILGDATLVRQLVMNLLTNASDALPAEGGDIVVRSGTRWFDAEYLQRTYVPAEIPGGEYVFLEVEDTGSGMDDETLQRIFDPFFTTKFAGRGLGLSVVFKTMQRHRGAVKVESRVGGGTRFLLLFPTAPAEAGADSPDSAAPPASSFSPASSYSPASRAPATSGAPATSRARGQVRVLVVDDEPLVRDVAKTVLEGCGWTVETAVDGDEALRRVRSPACFDLVLLDLTMPGIGGAATLAELKDLAPATRVVLMSGFDHRETADDPAAGADGFLQKPFTGKGLVRALETALRGG